MKLALIMAIIISALMVFFAVQNSQQTHVTFLGWYFDGPLVIVLLLSFGVGVIAAYLAMLPGTLRKSIEIPKIKSQLAECERKYDIIMKLSENKTQTQDQQLGGSKQ